MIQLQSTNTKYEATQEHTHRHMYVHAHTPAANTHSGNAKPRKPCPTLPPAKPSPAAQLEAPFVSASQLDQEGEADRHHVRLCPPLPHGADQRGEDVSAQQLELGPADPTARQGIGPPPRGGGGQDLRAVTFTAEKKGDK